MTLDDATRARLRGLLDQLLERSPARAASSIIFERPNQREIQAWIWARYTGGDELTALARAAFNDQEAVDAALSGAGGLHLHITGVLAWLVDQGVVIPTRGETP